MNASNLFKVFLMPLFTIIPSLAWATPIVFNFTGTISDQHLSNGSMQKSYSIIPKWLGKQVSGSISLDLDAVVPTWGYESQTIYESFYEPNNNFAQWMTVTINNPDGTSYSIAPALDPLPEVDANYAATYLSYRADYDDAQFVAYRNYSNVRKTPTQNIVFYISARGEDAHKLLNTTDFNTVNINTDFANWENYGSIYYVKENGKKMAYIFSVDSLTRVSSEVPEPGSFVLLVLGLFTITTARVIRYKN
jgi:hypothetical protein